MLRALHVALIFLTTLPLPPVRAWREDDARRSTRAYPLVGLVLGACLAAAWLLFGVFPDGLRGALLLGVGLLLTGALHFDGFCDVADAAFSSRSPPERQKIAKDPHFGVFAFAVGGVLLLVRAAALGALTQPAALLVIPLLSRTLLLLPLAYGRVHGSSRLGRVAQPRPAEVWLPLSLGLGFTAVIGWWTEQLTVFLALALAALFTMLALAWWLSSRLDGLGGDAYGALIETTEAVMLTLAVLR